MFDPDILSEWTTKVQKYGEMFNCWPTAHSFVKACLSNNFIPTRVACFAIAYHVPLSIAISEYEYQTGLRL